MTNFIIKQTEPGLYTVGTEIDGNWQPYEDCSSMEEAKQWIYDKIFPKSDQPKIKKVNEIIIFEDTSHKTYGREGLKIVQDGLFFNIVVFSGEYQTEETKAAFKDAGEMLRYLVREKFQEVQKIDGFVATSNGY